MSTTILMETFDTHMLDSGDADIPMYSGNSVAEPWLAVEASMTDDSFNMDSYSGHGDQSVEVEMQDHDGDITEYEMADEAESQRDNDAELLDVDVLDASRAVSPYPPEYTVTGLQSTSDVDFDATDPTSVRTELNSEAIPNSSEPDIATQTSDVAHADAQPDIATQISDVAHADAQSAHVDLVEETPDSAVAQIETLNADFVTLPGENQVESHTFTKGHSVSTEDQLDSSLDLPSGQGVETEDHVNEPLELLRDRELSVVQPSIPSTSVQPEQREEATVDPRDVEAQDAHNPDASLDSSSSRQNGLAVTHEDDAAASDPHEISEGVYIDPPPAVLLSIPTHSEPLGYCLFNQPLPGSGSQTPVGNKTATHALRLVLHHRPTLYYEPLSTVFEALRLEDCIRELPDVEIGELVLDAYDLQLVISEDNVHVHEVTLHDLNVLHDGADLSGPLRLELRVVSPRFISRYNALRDQIARLDLAADGEDGSHGEITLEPENQQNHDTTSLAVPQAGNNQGDEGLDHDPDGDGQSTGAEQQDFDETEQHDVGTHEEKLEGESATESAHGGEEHHENEFSEQNGGSSDDAEGEDDDEIQYEDQYGDNLDTDEVHRHADSNEGGDYTDYAEYVEDDDQRFGEDLPEELGGDQDGHPENAVTLKTPSTHSQSDHHSSNAQSGDEFAHGSSSEIYRPSESISGGNIHDVEDTREGTGAGEIPPTDVSVALSEDRDHENTIAKSNEVIESTEDQVDPDATASLASEGERNGDNVHPEASQSYYGDIENGEDDWADPPEFVDVPSPDVDTAALSRNPSTASSNKSSKRAHDELELDEDDAEYPPSSPGSKRLRMQ